MLLFQKDKQEPSEQQCALFLFGSGSAGQESTVTLPNIWEAGPTLSLAHDEHSKRALDIVRRRLLNGIQVGCRARHSTLHCVMCEDHVTFTFNLNVTPHGNSSRRPLNQTLGRPQSRRRDILFPLPEIKTRTVAVPTALCRML